MTKLIWDENRPYEMGLDRGVFYPQEGPGEAWNGLVSVSEYPGDEVLTKYIDGRKIEQHIHRGNFSGAINAYNYPYAFATQVFGKLRPKPFGLSYRGGVEGNQKIHLVYNVLVRPSAYAFQSDPDVFQWDFTSLPVTIPEAAPSAHLIIDASVAYSSALLQLEDVLYGTEAEAARLPQPEEVFNIFEANAILKVTDYGDGTFSIEGPDSAIEMLDATTFSVNWPSVIVENADYYNIRSL